MVTQMDKMIAQAEQRGEQEFADILKGKESNQNIIGVSRNEIVYQQHERDVNWALKRLLFPKELEKNRMMTGISQFMVTNNASR